MPCDRLVTVVEFGVRMCAGRGSLRGGHATLFGLYQHGPLKEHETRLLDEWKKPVVFGLLIPALGLGA